MYRTSAREQIEAAFCRKVYEMSGYHRLPYRQARRGSQMTQSAYKPVPTVGDTVRFYWTPQPFKRNPVSSQVFADRRTLTWEERTGVVLRISRHAMLIASNGEKCQIDKPLVIEVVDRMKRNEEPGK
jgi:hypothetical protein